jgi:hypothetical protein
MFNTPFAIDTQGTEFELSGNSRVFDVHVGRSVDMGSMLITVTANSFTQAASAAVDKANYFQRLFLEQHPNELLFGGRNIEYTPADVRKMEVVRTHVHHFRHKESHKQT